MEGGSGGSGKLRSACDACHRMKVRCSGNNPCDGCFSSDTACSYSYTGRLGRPKGAKTKRRVDGDGENGRPARRHQGGSEPEAQDGSRSLIQDESNQSEPSVNSHHEQQQHQQQTQQTSDGTLNSWTIYRDDDYHDPAFLDSITCADALKLPDINFADMDRHSLTGLFTPGFTSQNLGPSQKDYFNSHDASTGSVLFQQAFTASSQTSPQTRPSSSVHTPVDTYPIAQSVGCLDSTAALFPEDTLASCSCLAQNADLLLTLKASTTVKKTTLPDVAPLLDGIRKATKPWQDLVECEQCSQNTDPEAVMLALMSVRIILFRIRQLLPNQNATAGQLLEPDLLPQFEGDTGLQAKSTRVSVGTFEVTGPERTMVVKVLLLSTIRKTKAAILGFRDLLERKRTVMERQQQSTNGSSITSTAGPGANMPTSESGHSMCALTHVKQMLQSLIIFAQKIEGALDSC